MRLNQPEQDLVHDAVREYLSHYTRSVLTNPQGKRPSFFDFLGTAKWSSRAPARQFRDLVDTLGIEAEILLRDHVDSAQLGARAPTYTEAVEHSVRDFQKRQSELEAKLDNADLLRKDYGAILADTSLSEHEQVMLITLLATGKLTVEHAERVASTLRGYLGNLEASEGGADKTLAQLDSSIIRRYPMIFSVLVKSRFDQIVKERGYFATEDDRLAYFIKLAGEAQRRKDEFEPETTMHEVYNRVAERFNDIGCLTVPYARSRIRDPALKVSNLDTIINGIQARKTYTVDGLACVLGDAANNADVQKRLSGLSKGADVINALTVEFPGLHQLIALQMGLDQERFICADRMGTGKTGIGVLLVPVLAQKLHRPVKSLVVTPYGMMGEWERRIPQYLGPEAAENGYTARVISRTRDLEEVTSENLSGYTIINYEKLRRSTWTVEDITERAGTDDAEFEKAVQERLGQVRESKTTLTALLEQAKTNGFALEAQTIDRAVRLMVAAEEVSESKRIVTMLKKLPFDLLIVDESDLARNVDAQQTGAVIELGLNIRHYLELTATPVPHSIADLAKTVHLTQGKWTPRGFASDYPLEGFQTTFERNPALLSTVLASRMLRRTLRETADLKVKEINHRLTVSLEGYPEQRAAYIRILQAELHPTHKIQLLHYASLDPQLTGLDSSGEPYYTGKAGKSAKYDALFGKLDIDKREGRQGIIYTVYKEGVTRRNGTEIKGPILIDQLHERYDYAVRVIDGNVKGSEREAILEQYRQGKVSFVLLTAQAMGRGVDLSSARSVYHLGKTYLPDDFDQQNARAYRRGQVNNVHIHSLVIVDDAIKIDTDHYGVSGSLDEGIEILHEKRRQLSHLLLAGAGGWNRARLEELFSKQAPLGGYIGSR